jgi:hypothetical protein
VHRRKEGWINRSPFTGVPAHTDDEQWRPIDHAGPIFCPYARSAPPLSLSLVAGGGVRPPPECRSNGRRGMGSAPPLACSVGLRFSLVAGGDGRLPSRGARTAGDGRIRFTPARSDGHTN